MKKKIMESNPIVILPGKDLAKVRKNPRGFIVMHISLWCFHNTSTILDRKRKIKIALKYHSESYTIQMI